MKLSIITVNLNNRDGLQKTIDSVVSQTFKDFEWIVIDGGSNDGSRELIERFADHITYWVSEPDKGIYNAMNKGIRVAQGEYLLFLNSGDWLYNGTVLERFANGNYLEDIVYGNIIKVFGNGKEQNSKTDPLYCNTADKLTLRSLAFGTIPHQASFIKKDLFAKYGLYDESYKIVSDNVFYIKTILEGDASYRYIDMDVSFFDAEGIGNGCEEEHWASLTKRYPLYIVKDYLAFNDEIEKLKCRIKMYENNWVRRMGKTLKGLWES